MTKKVKDLKPGDVVMTAWGEALTVASAFEAKPGKGIKGAGWHVFWTDESGTLYKKNDIVELSE